MTTVTAIKTDGNLRHNISEEKKNKVIKVHSPKIRLRLQEACDNCEKAHISTVKYSLNPSKNKELSNVKTTEIKNGNYFSDTLPNRNKICQMDKIIFPPSSSSDKDQIDKPPPRCLGEASLSYLARNRGSLLIVGSGEGKPNPSDIHIRCPSKEAEDNLMKGRGLRMINVLQHSIDIKENPPLARIRDEEAAEISKKNQCGSMSDLMNYKKPHDAPVVKEPRCPTTEAMDSWKKSRGDSMSACLGGKVESDQYLSTSTPKKRVKDGFGNDIEPQKSDAMSQVMTRTKESYSPPRQEPRVRLDGKEIAEKNRGTLTHDIYNYNKVDPSSLSHPEPRVHRQGIEIANSSTGFLTKQLMQKYGQYPKDAKPKPRITQYSTKIAKQSQGGAMRDALCPPRQPHSKRKVRSAHR